MNPSKKKLEVGAKSETGYVRNENQDRMSGSEVPLGQLYIVADGMGGHKGGAMAAELTIVGLQRHIAAASSDASIEAVIRAAFKKVNQDVYQKAHSDNPETEGMGSTAVLLLISNGVARLAHVGDSRAYLYRQDQLRQLTKDHTIVQKMVDAGMLTLEEAANHPNASVLERAVGSKPSVEVDISDELRIHSGDAILLCSDGLSGYVTDAEIQEVLRGPATVQQVTEQLVQLALDQGGEDNITVQFVQYGPREEALSRPKGSQKLQPIEPGRPWRSYLATAVVLFLFAAVCAGLYFYFELKLTHALKQIDKVLEVAEINAKYGQNLREQLLKVEQDRDKISQAQEDLRSQASDMEKDSKSTNRKLQKTEKDLRKTKKDLRKTEKDLRKTKESLQKTETNLQAELNKINEAKIAISEELKKLGEQISKVQQDRNEINKAQEDLKLLASDMKKNSESIKKTVQETEKGLQKTEQSLEKTEESLQETEINLQTKLEKINEAKIAINEELKKLLEDLAKT